MPAPLSGPGLGLNLPKNLFPSELANAPYDAPTHTLALNSGDAIVIPNGVWYVDPGKVSILQWLDPVTGVWRLFPSARNQYTRVKSDGFTMRIANLTGCPVAGIVVAGGSGGVQASAAIVPSAGNSVWAPIIGGQISVATVANPGRNYGIAPLLFIQGPPPAASNPNGVGGVPASGICNINAGTVSGVTLTNVGAGYQTAPVGVIVPHPFDPNLTSGITNATVTFSLGTSGILAAALCQNPGASLASIGTFSLTVNNVGAASVSPVIMQTVILNSIVAVGLAVGNVANPALIMSAGGVPAAVPAFNNPAIELTNFIPRPFQATGVANAAGSITAVSPIYDSGLFLGTPTAVIALGQGGQSLGAANVGSIAFTMGGTSDTVFIQPAP